MSLTRGGLLRDVRDEIAARIEALKDRQSDLRMGLAHTDSDADIGEEIDALDDEIAHLEADLDAADAAVAREDPERRPWGRDGL